MTTARTTAPLAHFNTSPHERRSSAVNKHSPLYGVSAIRVYADPNAVASTASKSNGRVDATPSPTGAYLVAAATWDSLHDHGGSRRVAVGQLFDLWGAPVF